MYIFSSGLLLGLLAFSGGGSQVFLCMVSGLAMYAGVLPYPLMRAYFSLALWHFLYSRRQGPRYDHHLLQAHAHEGTIKAI